MTADTDRLLAEITERDRRWSEGDEPRKVQQIAGWDRRELLRIVADLRAEPRPATPTAAWTFEPLTEDGWAIIRPDSEDTERPYGYGDAVAWDRATAAFLVDAANRAAPEPQREPKTDCECGEPKSAGIHDPIRTWELNPNKLHAFRVLEPQRERGAGDPDCCPYCDGTGFVSDEIKRQARASNEALRADLTRRAETEPGAAADLAALRRSEPSAAGEEER